MAILFKDTIVSLAKENLARKIMFFSVQEHDGIFMQKYFHHLCVKAACFIYQCVYSFICLLWHIHMIYKYTRLYTYVCVHICADIYIYIFSKSPYVYLFYERPSSRARQPCALESRRRHVPVLPRADPGLPLRARDRTRAWSVSHRLACLNLSPSPPPPPPLSYPFLPPLLLPPPPHPTT